MMWAKVDHYDDVIMSEIASQITSLTIVYSTVHSGTDQSKHQSSASLAFVWEIHRWPVNFPHKWPVTRKIFPFDDVIMDPNGLCWSINAPDHLTHPASTVDFRDLFRSKVYYSVFNNHRLTTGSLLQRSSRLRDLPLMSASKTDVKSLNWKFMRNDGFSDLAITTQSWPLTTSAPLGLFEAYSR